MRCIRHEKGQMWLLCLFSGLALDISVASRTYSINQAFSIAVYPQRNLHIPGIYRLSAAQFETRRGRAFCAEELRSHDQKLIFRRYWRLGMTLCVINVVSRIFATAMMTPTRILTTTSAGTWRREILVFPYQRFLA